MSLARNKIVDALELDFENSNKNNVQEKERIDTEFKKEKNKFNELKTYVGSNTLVFFNG